MIDQPAFADLQEALWIVYGPLLHYVLVGLVAGFVGLVILLIALALLRRMFLPPGA